MVGSACGAGVAGAGPQATRRLRTNTAEPNNVQGFVFIGTPPFAVD
jgi:hypothetical protein